VWNEEGKSGFWKGNMVSCMIFPPNYIIDIGLTAALENMEEGIRPWLRKKMFCGIDR